MVIIWYLLWNKNLFESFLRYEEKFIHPSLKCYYCRFFHKTRLGKINLAHTIYYFFYIYFPRLRRFDASLYLLNGERIKPYIYPTCSLNTSIWRTSNLLAGFTHSLTSCHSYLLKIFAHTLRQWQIRAVGTAKKR